MRLCDRTKLIIDRTHCHWGSETSGVVQPTPQVLGVAHLLEDVCPQRWQVISTHAISMPFAFHSHTHSHPLYPSPSPQSRTYIESVRHRSSCSTDCGPASCSSPRFQGDSATILGIRDSPSSALLASPSSASSPLPPPLPRLQSMRPGTTGTCGYIGGHRIGDELQPIIRGRTCESSVSS